MPRFKFTEEGLVPFTEQEELDQDEIDKIILSNQPIIKAQEIRNERNILLSDSDWTQLSDANVDKDAWLVYRKALRDVPQQSGFPLEVTWPNQPE